MLWTRGYWSWEENVDWTWVGAVLGAYPALTYSVLQVATAHPLRAEEPRPRPRPSPPTLCPHRLEASPHRRASHRAMAPHHSSVSATPVGQTPYQLSSRPAVPAVTTPCTYPPGLRFHWTSLDYWAGLLFWLRPVMSRHQAVHVW